MASKQIVEMPMWVSASAGLLWVGFQTAPLAVYFSGAHDSAVFDKVGTLFWLTVVASVAATLDGFICLFGDTSNYESLAAASKDGGRTGGCFNMRTNFIWQPYKGASDLSTAMYVLVYGLFVIPLFIGFAATFDQSDHIGGNLQPLIYALVISALIVIMFFTLATNPLKQEAKESWMYMMFVRGFLMTVVLLGGHAAVWAMYIFVPLYGGENGDISHDMPPISEMGLLQAAAILTFVMLSFEVVMTYLYHMNWKPVVEMNDRFEMFRALVRLGRQIMKMAIVLLIVVAVAISDVERYDVDVGNLEQTQQTSDRALLRVPIGATTGNSRFFVTVCAKDGHGYDLSPLVRDTEAVYTAAYGSADGPTGVVSVHHIASHPFDDNCADLQLSMDFAAFSALAGPAATQGLASVSLYLTAESNLFSLNAPLALKFKILRSDPVLDLETLEVRVQGAAPSRANVLSLTTHEAAATPFALQARVCHSFASLDQNSFDRFNGTVQLVAWEPSVPVDQQTIANAVVLHTDALVDQSIPTSCEHGITFVSTLGRLRLPDDHGYYSALSLLVSWPLDSDAANNYDKDAVSVEPIGDISDISETVTIRLLSSLPKEVHIASGNVPDFIPMQVNVTLHCIACVNRDQQTLVQFKYVLNDVETSITTNPPGLTLGVWEQWGADKDRQVQVSFHVPTPRAVGPVTLRLKAIVSVRTNEESISVLTSSVWVPVQFDLYATVHGRWHQFRVARKFNNGQAASFVPTIQVQKSTLLGDGVTYQVEPQHVPYVAYLMVFQQTTASGHTLLLPKHMVDLPAGAASIVQTGQAIINQTGDVLSNLRTREFAVPFNPSHACSSDGDWSDCEPILRDLYEEYRFAPVGTSVSVYHARPDEQLHLEDLVAGDLLFTNQIVVASSLAQYLNFDNVENVQEHLRVGYSLNLNDWMQVHHAPQYAELTRAADGTVSIPIQFNLTLSLPHRPARVPLNPFVNVTGNFWLASVAHSNWNHLVPFSIPSDQFWGTNQQTITTVPLTNVSRGLYSWEVSARATGSADVEDNTFGLITTFEYTLNQQLVEFHAVGLVNPTVTTPELTLVPVSGESGAYIVTAGWSVCETLGHFDIPGNQLLTTVELFEQDPDTLARVADVATFVIEDADVLQDVPAGGCSPLNYFTPDQHVPLQAGSSYAVQVSVQVLSS